MNRFWKMGLTAMISLLFLSACSSKYDSNMLSSAAEQVGLEHMTMDQMGSAIMAAGEEQGWKMTEFKNNEMLAEKFGDDEASASIKYDDEGFDVHSDSESGAVDDLKEAIMDKLSGMVESH